MIDVEQIIHENIDRMAHMSLGTVGAGGRPWVCEVHFVYDDALNLYFRSLESRRHSQDIVANSNVAGNIVDKFAVGESGVVGLYFEGQAEQVGDLNEIEQVATNCAKRLGADKQQVIDEATSVDGHKIYRVTVTDWYVFGRFGADRGQKLHLARVPI